MQINIAFKKTIPLDKRLLDKIASKSVQIWTNSEYYHVEFFYNNIWYGISPKGVEKYPLRPLSDKYDYITFDIEVSSKQQGLVEKFLNIDFIYDWKGIIFSQFFPIGLNDNEKWFCSEYVTKILQLFLVEEVLFVHPHMIDPGNLFDLIKNKNQGNNNDV